MVAQHISTILLLDQGVYFYIFLYMTEMNRMAVSCAVVLFTLVNCCSSANIVILVLPVYSHLVGPANVAELLQSQGHNVVIAIPPQLKGKLESHGVDVLLYHALGDFPEQRLLKESLLKDYFETRSVLSSILSQLRIGDITNGFADMGKLIWTKIVKDSSLLKDIKNFKPDLMILDAGTISIISTLIPYKLDIPFVMIGCDAPFIRAPVLPAVFPQEMTFPQRAHNTFIHLLAYWQCPFMNSSLIYDVAAEKPYISLIDLPTKAELWILRQPNGVLDYNEPTMPNVKRVSHLRNFTPKPLAQEFQSFLNTAANGVVIVSFGSMLAAVPSQIQDKLIKAFEQTKFKFIIQGTSRQNDQSEKFMYRQWLPQFDLLNHKKTKLLIYHCGSNGLQEALVAGVPIIGFPLFVDQPQNARNVLRKGFGLKLDLRSFSVEELVFAIEEVTTNPSYQASVEKASAILKSERVPPVEEAAFWINHVLTFGGDHLRSYAQDIPLWKYFGLDIIAFCLLLWHAFLYLVIIVLKFCFLRCFGGKN